MENGREREGRECKEEMESLLKRQTEEVSKEEGGEGRERLTKEERDEVQEEGIRRD